VKKKSKKIIKNVKKILEEILRKKFIEERRLKHKETRFEIFNKPVTFRELKVQ